MKKKLSSSLLALSMVFNTAPSISSITEVFADSGIEPAVAIDSNVDVIGEIYSSFTSTFGTGIIEEKSITDVKSEFDAVTVTSVSVTGSATPFTVEYGTLLTDDVLFGELEGHAYSSTAHSASGVTGAITDYSEWFTIDTDASSTVFYNAGSDFSLTLGFGTGLTSSLGIATIDWATNAVSAVAFSVATFGLDWADDLDPDTKTFTLLEATAYSDNGAGVDLDADFDKMLNLTEDMLTADSGVFGWTFVDATAETMTVKLTVTSGSDNYDFTTNFDTNFDGTSATFEFAIYDEPVGQPSYGFAYFANATQQDSTNIEENSNLTIGGIAPSSGFILFDDTDSDGVYDSGEEVSSDSYSLNFAFELNSSTTDSFGWDTSVSGAFVSSDVIKITASISSDIITDMHGESASYTINIVEASNTNTGAYEITFSTDGGSSVSSLTTTNGKLTTLPSAPTKDGYTFLGWATTSGGDIISLTSDYSFSEATVLYAIWEEDATILEFTPDSAFSDLDTLVGGVALSTVFGEANSTDLLAGVSADIGDSALGFEMTLTLEAIDSSASYGFAIEVNGSDVGFEFDLNTANSEFFSSLLDGSVTVTETSVDDIGTSATEAGVVSSIISFTEATPVMDFKFKAPTGSYVFKTKATGDSWTTKSGVTVIGATETAINVRTNDLEDYIATTSLQGNEEGAVATDEPINGNVYTAVANSYTLSYDVVTGSSAGILDTIGDGYSIDVSWAVDESNSTSATLNEGTHFDIAWILDDGNSTVISATDTFADYSSGDYSFIGTPSYTFGDNAFSFAYADLIEQVTFDVDIAIADEVVLESVTGAISGATTGTVDSATFGDVSDKITWELGTANSFTITGENASAYSDITAATTFGVAVSYNGNVDNEIKSVINNTRFNPVGFLDFDLTYDANSITDAPVNFANTVTLEISGFDNSKNYDFYWVTLDENGNYSKFTAEGISSPKGSNVTIEVKTTSFSGLVWGTVTTSSGGYGSSSSGSSSSGSSSSGSSNSGSVSTGAGYSYSGNVSVNGTYINELRGVLVGEMVNLDRITTVNGQEVLGWYYDAAFTQPVSNTSTFVFTSDVISNGLYAKTTGSASSTLPDGSTNAGAGGVTSGAASGGTTSGNSSYVPSVVPSTVAKILSKLF